MEFEYAYIFTNLVEISSRCKMCTHKFYLLTIFVSFTHCMNILVLFPHPGKSHFLMYSHIFKTLAIKGHNITVISYYPQKENISNYRDVVLGDGSVQKNPEFLSMETFLNLPRFRWIDGLFMFDKYYERTCSVGYDSENFKRFLKEENKFDLILVQYFISDCFMGLVKVFDVPVIGK